MNGDSSNNFSNGPNTTNASELAFVDYSDVTFAWDISLIFTVIFIAAGTFFNLWFLVAILRSRVLRSRLRNKTICNILVLNLVDTAVVIPGFNISYIISRFGIHATCPFYSTLSTILFIQDAVANWQVLLLIIVFIAQILDFNLNQERNPRKVKYGTWALLIIPWVMSVFMIISSSAVYKNCFFVTSDAFVVLKVLDTFLPLCLSVLLMVVAVVLRYIRFNRGRSRSMGVDLMCKGPEIDSSRAYIAAVVVSTACDTLRAIDILDYSLFWSNRLMINHGIYIFITLLSYLRAVLMALPWLFLPDIRERIRTWRPCIRPGPGIDLTMTYKKETT